MNTKFCYAIAVLISSLFVFQATFAAEATVYNETDEPVLVRLFYGQLSPQATDMVTINADKEENKSHFSSKGLHAFNGIVWMTMSTGKCFKHTAMPSSRAMLAGSITLRKNGRFDVNFDANGVGDVKQKVALPVSCG